MDTSLVESSSAEGFVNPGPNWNSTSQTWQLAQAGAAAVASDAAAAGAAASSATTAATTAATATAGAVGQTAGLLLGVGAATAAVLALQERDTTAPKVTAVVDDSPAELANGDIAFTVTFDEALTGTVGTNNFSATNGTVTSVTRVGSSNAYTVVVTPTVNLASAETLLESVVPSEMPASMPAEALKAQAVAARLDGAAALAAGAAKNLHRTGWKYLWRPRAKAWKTTRPTTL
jgi:stage II sporulation protein D